MNGELAVDADTWLQMVTDLNNQMGGRNVPVERPSDFFEKLMDLACRLEKAHGTKKHIDLNLTSLWHASLLLALWVEVIGNAKLYDPTRTDLTDGVRRELRDWFASLPKTAESVSRLGLALGKEFQRRITPNILEDWETIVSPRPDRPRQSSTATFESLIKPGKLPLKTISGESSVKETLTQMEEAGSGGFSQLGVETPDEGLRLVRVERLAFEIRRRGAQVLEERVAKFSEPVPVAEPVDTIRDLWRKGMSEKEAVVLRGDVLHILTTWDLAEYLDDAAGDFLLIREMETTLREIVRQRIGDPVLIDGDEKHLEKTTIGRLVAHITGDWWLQLTPVFGDPDVTRGNLDDLVRIRDHICHFRGWLGLPDKQKLRTVHEWIAGLVRVSV